MHPGNISPAHTGGEAVLRFFEARTAQHVFGLPGRLAANRGKGPSVVRLRITSMEKSGT